MELNILVLNIKLVNLYLGLNKSTVSTAICRYFVNTVEIHNLINLILNMSVARVTTCEKCCVWMNVAGLNLLNIIDFFLGGFLIIAGLYVRNKNGSGVYADPVTAWLPISVVIVGFVLVVEVALSCCATSSKGLLTSKDLYIRAAAVFIFVSTFAGCRWIAPVSGCFAVLIGLFSLSLGIF